MPDSINFNPPLSRKTFRVLTSIELVSAILVIFLIFLYALVKTSLIIAGAYAFLVTIPFATFLLGPFWGLLLYLPTTFVKGIPLGETPFTVNQLAGVLFIIGWCRWWLQGKTHFKVTPFFWLLTVAFIYFSLSALFSEDPPATLESFKTIVIYYILSIVIASMLNSGGDIAIFCWLIVGITFIHATFGFYEFFSGNDILVKTRARWEGTFRINGASANAIVYGQLLIFTLPFGYYLFTEMRNVIFKLIALGLTLFILLVSVLTLARQVVIILILQLFIIPVLFKSRSSPVFLILLLVAALLSAPYVGYKITRRMETLKTEQLRRDRSLLVRLDAIKVGKKIFAQKPLFGIGLGAFPTRWGKYAGFDTFSLHLERVDKIYPDCTYNQLISETGLIGFILALTLYLGVAATAWKKRRLALRQSNISLANCSSIVLVLILVILVKNFIVDTFLETRTWMLFAMTMALLKPGFMEEKTAADIKQSDEKSDTQPRE